MNKFKTVLIITLANLLISSSIFAQAPEKMSYQAVIRNASNQLVTNTSVGMQISILQSSTTGTAVYVETQIPTTNANGLVTIEIGTGTVVSGNFSTIDWANDTYFIKTETDLNGGSSYTITGTSQLLSVPYALHAKTAESITGGSSSHYVGELYGGGIVYWIDQTGQHGLIASLDDLDGGSGVAWSNIDDLEIGASAKDYYNGVGNTTAIISQSGHISSAAKLCADYSIGGFSDWYLPSTLELREMDNAILIINNVLSNDGNSATNPLHPEYVLPTSGRYWSSTEYDNNTAWYYYFYYGYSTNYSGKANTYRVRAVRAF